MDSLHSYNASNASLPEDRPSAWWWLHDRNTVIYFFRELTGVGIALYGILFILMWFFNALNSKLFEVITWIGLVSAVFHSLTWLGVTLKITPFDLPRWVERVGFLGLLLVWGVVSYFLLHFFYVR